MAAFPEWTRLFFKNATSPTGWIKDTNDTYDHGLRIVSGYLGSSTIVQNNSSPWSQTMVNTTYPFSATGGSSGSTNPAVQDIPAHAHSTTDNRYSGTLTSATLYSAGGGSSTSRLLNYSFTASNSSSPNVGSGTGVHSHTTTVTASVVNPATFSTNFTVKYTDLILSYKTGSISYSIYLDNNKTSMIEGSGFRIRMDVPTTVPIGKKFIWNIIPISSSPDDFGALTGIMTISAFGGRGASANNVTNVKYYATGSRYFKYEIIDPTIGSTVFMSTPIEIIDYYTEWSVSLTSEVPEGINEGATLTFDYYLAPGSSLTGYWRIKHGGTGGVISNASDFVGATSGSVGPKANVNDENVYPITIKISNDITTEFGGEDFAIECSDTSNFAVIRFTSLNYHINDTSRTTVITFENPTTSLNEGQTVTYTVNSTGADNGTVFYWNITFSGDVNDVEKDVGLQHFIDFDVSNGSFTLNVNPSTGVGTASFSFAVLNDFLTDGNETFKIEIRRDTVLTGPVVTTSPIITIVDTSKTASFSWVSVPTAINENTNNTFTVNIGNFDPGNNLTFNVVDGQSANTVQPTSIDDFVMPIYGLITTTGTYATNTGSFNIPTAMGTRDSGPKAFTVQVIRNDTSAVVLTQNVTLNDNLREPQGQIEFTRNTIGGTYVNQNSTTRFGQGGGPYVTFSWTVPNNVYSISAVCIGAAGGYGGVGGGGGGGALCYRNYINVTPGEVLSIHVGATGTYGYSSAPTSATYGGQSLVQTSNGIMAFAGGGYGGYGVAGWSGGSFGLTKVSNIQSDKTGTLVAAMTSTTSSISVTMPSGIPADILSWNATGTIIIDNEWIGYSSRGVNTAGAFLTLNARGKVQYTGGPGAAAHAAGAIVKYFPGGIFSGGAGATGSSTTRGAQGGAGQFNSAGGTGTGAGTATGQTGGAVWGSASGSSGGGAVRIIWGGYYRSYPSTNIGNL